MKLKLAAVLAAVVGLSGCVSQDEMALSKNVYKIDVDARGLIPIAIARGQMQQRVAESTIAKGYTHYIIQQAGSQSGSIYAGNTPVYGNTTVNVYGNTAYANTTYTGGHPINIPTYQNSIIVAMFKAPNVPAGALDAAEVLAASKPKKKKNAPST
ncbi:hypothetical protein [Ensifer sp. SSB1]|uniref:hypothetical protein n=1 Tax=Ensifer sp. SSB1 TaxID=2795385 RepID=UPI001A5C5AD2|nr:hypothetical protein [Ensifer sp. SSB1]MBK5571271.1 hypothetical protein [Ensifer sp. SSB1]